MRVLVTGDQGFIGRNLVAVLQCRHDLTLTFCDVSCSEQQLADNLRCADIVFHLAGVNRPPAIADYEAGNFGFTQHLCNQLIAAGRATKIVFASSTQAVLDNPYGRSKRLAEECLRSYSDRMGACVTIYRWTNLFGKWCRPNYNSVTATFCHNIARGLPLEISAPDRLIELVYIDDVVTSLVGQLSSLERQESDCSRVEMPIVEPVYSITLRELAAKVRSFRELRSSLELPEISDRFTRCLYATYLSYLPEFDFAYPLDIRRDDRGELAEFLKSSSFGQIFISRTKPGITRGNHFHHTKVEKFLVVEGEAVVRFRRIDAEEVIEYPVSGKDFRVVDIPPGYTHSIENVGTGEMVVLFWASEVFDPQLPDTFYQEVLHG